MSSKEEQVNAIVNENIDSTQEMIDSILAIKGEPFCNVVLALFTLLRANDTAQHAVSHCDSKECGSILMLGFISCFTDIGSRIKMMSGLSDKEWEEAADWMNKLHERDTITQRRVTEFVRANKEE